METIYLSLAAQFAVGTFFMKSPVVYDIAFLVSPRWFAITQFDKGQNVQWIRDQWIKWILCLNGLSVTNLYQNGLSSSSKVKSIKPYRSIKPSRFFLMGSFPTQSCQTKIFTFCLLICFLLNTNILSLISAVYFICLNRKY